MKTIKRIFGIGCLLWASTVAVAHSDFGIWTSIEGSTKLNKKVELSVEGEYRTQDMSSMTERISGTMNLSYKDKDFLPFLKADIGYTFMHMRYQGEATIKYDFDEGRKVPKHMNVDSPYWTARHRATASLTGSFKWNRLKFSLRERYQYTYRQQSQCARTRYYYLTSTGQWNYDNPVHMTDEKKAKSDHKLRSRLSVSCDIKKSPFEPYVEVEIYNNLDKALAYDKTRYTIGTEYKIDKNNKLKFYYRYQDYVDIEDLNTHVIGLGYSIEF